jgi:hypothetical protein
MRAPDGLADVKTPASQSHSRVEAKPLGSPFSRPVFRIDALKHVRECVSVNFDRSFQSTFSILAAAEANGRSPRLVVTELPGSSQDERSSLDRRLDRHVTARAEDAQLAIRRAGHAEAIGEPSSQRRTVGLVLERDLAEEDVHSDHLASRHPRRRSKRRWHLHKPAPKRLSLLIRKVSRRPAERRPMSR